MSKLMTVAALTAALVALNDEEKKLLASAKKEGRFFNDAERKRLEEITNEFDETEAELERLKMIEARDAKLGKPEARVTQPEPTNEFPDDAQIEGGLRAGATPGKFGFRNMGEWAKAIKSAAFGSIDDRLVNAATTFGSEGTNADGGFAVPPDFRQEIQKKLEAEESLLPLTDEQRSMSNKITFPMDNTTPHQTSGGIQAYWEDEAATMTQSKPALGQIEVPLKKIQALVPLTDELMEDAPALARYLPGKVADKLASKFNDAIVNGNGVGRPLGLMNSPSKVSVAKESGQAAATVVFANLAKMWSRLHPSCRGSAVWLINQDVEPQLLSLVAPGSNSPAYLPPGGLSGSQYSTLFGRRVIPVETCETVGTEGDIVVAGMKHYLTVQKTAGVRQDISIHAYFDQGITAFRFITRLGGQSWWSSAVTRQKGSNTLTNVVSLAVRS